MKVLITGSKGFIGKNLSVRLNESSVFKLLTFDRGESHKALEEKISSSDYIIHLAGENRPSDPDDFDKVNVELTKSICSFIKKNNRKIPIIFSSSSQVKNNNSYGKSKLLAEKAIKKLYEDTQNPSIIYRFPGVFGKWCKPNYNSVVATFCYNISRGLPIKIDDPQKELCLVFIDDLISNLIRNIIEQNISGIKYEKINPEYSITIGKLADQIRAFNDSRSSLIYEEVGTGLVRALYATFVSYFTPKYFTYDLPRYSDDRGDFIEIFKTPNSGQFSYFTAKPGVTRGEHYHHSKTEKFLIVKGSGLFSFRNIITKESHEICTTDDNPQIVQTIPGWSHNIKNIGKGDLIVFLWANEIFDRENPDTITSKV